MPEEAACWHIWSGEHRAWWRRDSAGRGAGYVTFIDAAGKWTQAEAEAMTRHCGPEKKIMLIPDPYGPDALVEHHGQHFTSPRARKEQP